MIDTKGWAGWGGRTAWRNAECIALYQQTGDPAERCVRSCSDWFCRSFCGRRDDETLIRHGAVF
ncbi:hypothetical protein KCP76_20920 [Salmonella enterica subsp. enterica serovar Weltevreden]|nr:hypothetical protein KCP76_20920 [Salmonella enterica subsp. enterica serovar Weltevreden]